MSDTATPPFPVTVMQHRHFGTDRPICEGCKQPLDAASPPAADPLDVDADLLFEALSFLGEDDILADGSLWKIGEIALNAAAEYARLAREGEER